MQGPKARRGAELPNILDISGFASRTPKYTRYIWICLTNSQIYSIYLDLPHELPNMLDISGLASQTPKYARYIWARLTNS
jgi:hypothetical protein